MNNQKRNMTKLLCPSSFIVFPSLDHIILTLWTLKVHFQGLGILRMLRYFKFLRTNKKTLDEEVSISPKRGWICALQSCYLPWLFDQTVLHLHMIQVPYLQNPQKGPMSNDKANCKKITKYDKGKQAWERAWCKRKIGDRKNGEY